jgi:hypothetical protein
MPRFAILLLLQCPVLRNCKVLLLGLSLVPMAAAQQSQQPKVKVNVLNVCSPSAEEQQEISSALTRIPKQTSFTQDFEVDRGRSLADQTADFLPGGQKTVVTGDTSAADWVRIRREFPEQNFFTTVQYSFSHDAQNMVETLVFRVRDPKDLLEVAIEDSASAVTTPASMLATDTPATRIKLERFGKSSVVLARCSGTENSPPPDQSAYEPLFQSGSAVLANYRNLLGVRHTVPDELARIGTGASPPTRARKPVPMHRPQQPLNPN